MKLIILTGFLGSGKTTLLLHVAHHLTDQRREKVAIIENEIGKVGVDDAFLSENGLPYKEIYSGCVCCSLRLDLITTLLELERSFQPDVVILEPSGVADPKHVVNALAGYGGEINGKIVLTIVDAERFRKLQALSIPLIQHGIDIADLILINKRDLVAEQDRLQLEARIRELRADAKILDISATTKHNLTRFTKELDDLLLINSIPRQSAPPNTAEKEPHGPKPVVQAERKTIRFAPAISRDEFQNRMTKAFNATLKELRSDAPLIGHIKLIAKHAKGGYLLASVTDLERDPSFKGKLPACLDELEITLNAIVFHTDRNRLEQASKRLVETLALTQ